MSDQMEAVETDTPDEFDLMMMDPNNDEPSFPLNRIVAFLGPYISALAGFIATWLINNVAVFNTLNVTHDQVLSGVTNLIVFVLVAGLTWLGQRKWLTGHIAWEAGQMEIQKAAVAGYASTLPPAIEPPKDKDYDEKAAKEEMLRRTKPGGTV